MSFLDWFKSDKKLTDYSADELKREEGRLQIRESQLIARLEKLEVEREIIFRQGAGVGSPIRRRILARKYEERARELSRVEGDLTRHMKELMIVSAIRFRMERRAQGETSLLKKVGGSEVDLLRELSERDDIDEEMYADKLTEILGAVEGPAADPVAGLGDEARSVLDVWARMDDGVIGTVEEGLEEARHRSDEEGVAQEEG